MLDLAAFVSDLIGDIRDMPSVWDPNDATTRHGFQTRENLLVLPETSFSRLEDLICDQLNASCEDFGESDYLLMTEWPENLRLTPTR